MWGQLVLHCKILVPAGGAGTCSLQQQLPAAKLIMQLVADSQQVLPSDSILDCQLLPQALPCNTEVACTSRL